MTVTTKKTKTCIYCGGKSRKAVCGKCKCVKYFVKNGGNTRISRQEVAFNHMSNKPGIMKQIFGL